MPPSWWRNLKTKRSPVRAERKCGCSFTCTATPPSIFSVYSGYKRSNKNKTVAQKKKSWFTLDNSGHRPATSTNRDNFPLAPADFHDIIPSEFRNAGSPKTPAALITFFREDKKTGGGEGGRTRGTVWWVWTEAWTSWPGCRHSELHAIMETRCRTRPSWLVKGPLS